MTPIDLGAAAPFLTLGVGGTAAILGGALALGIRHGIDWDHIAAITDITSSAATVQGSADSWLVDEPGLLLSDESRHGLALAATSSSSGVGFGSTPVAYSRPAQPLPTRLRKTIRSQRQPFLLGTMYALGHGTMVVFLGLLAILFQQILPGWVDPLMERVVGATLVFLSAYLFYSLYRYFRSGDEFRIRSRWMVVFAAVGNVTHRLSDQLQGRQAHHHGLDNAQQYGAGTAYGVGLIHGIGAETGTQVLIIGTAVGAASKGMGVATLFVFVFGIIVSNSFVTVMTTTGFVSARRRQVIYVAVGMVAAVFSLIVGLVFLSRSADILPSLDQYVRWIGGPS
jgi:hypothetical protein